MNLLNRASLALEREWQVLDGDAVHSLSWLVCDVDYKLFLPNAYHLREPVVGVLFVITKTSQAPFHCSQS